MGKRILVQRRGDGGMRYRSHNKGKIAPASYPFLDPSNTSNGIVKDLLHERGRSVPLAKVIFGNKTSYLPAVHGLKVNQEISIGSDSEIQDGNILPLRDIPEGTSICNIERTYGDGGKIAKSAGTSALLYSKTSAGSIVRLRSGKSILIQQNCRATIGALAGAGFKEKPFLKAGNKAHYAKAYGHLHPKVRGVAMGSHYHPFGGGRHQSPHQSTSTSRNAPPGRKVGSIAASKTGPGRARRKSRITEV